VLLVQLDEAGPPGHVGVHGNLLLLWEWIRMAIDNALPFLSEQKERLESTQEKMGEAVERFYLPRSGFVQQS